MTNLLDYLDWRGDLSFSVSPLNEVDYYILSTLGVFDFVGIVPADSTGCMLRDAAARYFEKYGENPRLGAVIPAEYTEMLKRAAKTARFGALYLSAYRSRLVEETGNEEQFSAITVSLPDGSRFVSFRGTDDTLAGWKEDCMLAVREVIPAQLSAVQYLREAAGYSGPLYVGGHSKGGNLAVYAAANVPPAVQDRIVYVISLDGPGFPEAFFRSRGYTRINRKVLNYMPQSSIVGTLFEHRGQTRYVHSDAFGPVAHSGFTWEVKGCGFVRMRSLSKSSKIFRTSFGNTLSKMDTEARQRFIDEFFDMLSAGGAETLTDLSASALRQIPAVLRVFNRGSEVRTFLLRFLDELRKDAVAERGHKT